MLLIDSDSLVYIIEIENGYKSFHKDVVLFEFINYPKEPKYYDLNNLIVFKMKDETCGVPINGFIGLKSKMDTFTKEDNNECKKSEGINKNVAVDELTYEDYINVLFNRSYIKH